MTMLQQTFLYGMALVFLGVGSYYGLEQSSKTALIPAGFGAVAFVLGLIGRNEGARKHAMHGVLVVAMLALLGSARGLPGLVTMIQGGEVERPAAVISQTVMFALSLQVLMAGVRSFAAARRARAE
jgi:hypothetical protein